MKRPSLQRPAAWTTWIAFRAIFTSQSPWETNKTWTKKHPMVNTAKPMSPMSCVRKSFVCMALSLVFPGLAFGQTNVPSGGEYALGGALPGNQFRPAVAAGSSGGVVAWDDDACDLFGFGIRARLFDEAFGPVGEAFLVNQTIVGDQQHPAVSLLNDGGSMVVWESGKPGAQNVHARFIDPVGAFTTGEILVNTAAYSVNHRITTNWTLIRNNKLRPKRQRIREIAKLREEYNNNLGAATLKDGSLAVVYTSSRKYEIKSYALSERVVLNRHSVLITNRTRVPYQYAVDYMQDVYLQRLSSTGAKLGDEIVVNSSRSLNQRSGKVAALESGGFVVVWIHEVPGNDFKINSSVSKLGGGRVDVFYQIFGAAGNRIGPEVRVNDIIAPCGAPVVIGRADGGFTVAWVQRHQLRDSGFDIWFRAFDSSGAALGASASANSHTYGDQFAPALGRIGSQELLVWSSMGQDGSWEGVYARNLQGGSLSSEPEIRVNTRTYLRQINPAVAGHGSNAVVVWSGYNFDTGFDISGQRYHLP
jgi:hypothetical protein